MLRYNPDYQSEEDPLTSSLKLILKSILSGAVFSATENSRSTISLFLRLGAFIFLVDSLKRFVAKNSPLQAHSFLPAPSSHSFSPVLPNRNKSNSPSGDSLSPNTSTSSTPR